MLSAADRLKTQNTLPSDSAINVSPRADTDIDVPVHSIGQEEIPAQVIHQTDNMKACAYIISNTWAIGQNRSKTWTTRGRVATEEKPPEAKKDPAKVIMSSGWMAR